MNSRELYNAAAPLEWFEALYRQAEGRMDAVPWADERPNHNLVAWCKRADLPRSGDSALVVGCGLGDDAEYLALRGAKVTAFDIAPTAIQWCCRRFPLSAVRYETADLFTVQWPAPFAFVAECYTLQALPASIRPEAMQRLAGMVAPGGDLIVICRGRDPQDPEGSLPWPLTRTEFEVFGAAGLDTLSFEDYDDPEEPGKRRFRVHLRRPPTLESVEQANSL